MLSSRMTRSYLGPPDFLMDNFGKASSDPFDSEKNPDGFVNLGTAVNALNEADIESWLLQDGVFQHQRPWQHYHQLSGHEDVKEKIARFLSEQLKTPQPLSPHNLNFQAGNHFQYGFTASYIFSNFTGVSTLLESLAFALGDPGDVFVIHFPVYPRFASDISERAQIKLMGPALRAANNFQLSPSALDDYITELKEEQGQRVKAFIHCNPNNPLGDIYDMETTLNLMRVCKKHRIHFISDEIYALSIFDDKRRHEFKSVLAMEDVPDPQRTHFVWGFSKDFGIASFRFGVLHTWNEELMTIMNGMCLYSSVEGHIQQIGGKMLTDQTWLNQVYFPKNLSRLKNAFEECSTFFQKFGCETRRASAGLFAWVNLAPMFTRPITEESERKLFMTLLNDFKLYIPNGIEFGSKDPGWFRVIFAIKRDHWREFCRRFTRFAAKQQLQVDEK